MTDILPVSIKPKPPKLANQTNIRLFNGQLEVVESSRELKWNGILVEKQILEPSEMPEVRSNRYLLAQWGTCGVGEHAIGRGFRSPFIKPAGTLTFVPPGIIPAARTENRNELLCCSLDLAFVETVEDELEQRPGEHAYARTGFTDLRISRLLELLIAEASEGGEAGLLYIDHLAHALATRISSLGTVYLNRSRSKRSPLPPAVIRRVIEYMHKSDERLDLQSLARESGYSRGHFLRGFQISTGLTPHRYLMNIRLQRAQELMKEKSRPLIDIALSCGFASHSHMSRIFRGTMGMTPMEYRRQL